MSVSSCFDGTPMARSTVSDNCMTRSWGFIGNGGRTNPQNIQHIVSGSGRVAEVGDGQISGMLELARHGDGQCLHGSSGTAYDESGGVVSCSFADKKRWGFTILVAFAGSDHHTDEIAASYDRKVPTDLFATLHQMDNIRTADLDLGPMASLDDSEVLYSFLRKTHAANWHKGGR
ncbi:hypothetical protein BHE74_00008142 [Ensete ventricosum]|nr:hypothetical protein BHE74_00008142 [Ensete ventricosum]RZR99341.1 hypothetical protein BHM03_00028860 [Ensete ventricosum]